MTIDELRRIKPGEKLICTGHFRYFTSGEAYTVYDSPVGKTVQNDNGVNIYIFEILENFKVDDMKAEHTQRIDGNNL